MHTTKMFLENYGHFGRHLGFLTKLLELLGTYSMLFYSYSRSYSENVGLLSGISSIQLIFLENDTILDAILDFLKSSRGIVGDVSMLFYSYSWSYPENFSLL